MRSSIIDSLSWEAFTVLQMNKWNKWIKESKREFSNKDRMEHKEQTQLGYLAETLAQKNMRLKM